MNILFPSNTKAIIDKIRNVIGREIELIYLLESGVCGECDLDSVTGKSYDPFCRACSGTGVLTSVEVLPVSGHILWGRVDTTYNSPAGRIFTGDCKVTISYSDDVLTLLDSVEYFLVDDKKLYLKDFDLRGVKEINRIALNLQQDPRDGR